MSDTGKTITISKEAYLEIKRLNKENAALVKRWEELERWLLKDSWAEAVSPAVWAKMKELEGGKG